MDGYGEIEDKILDEIFSECEKCPYVYACIEKDCILYRIEKIITQDEEE